MDNNYAKLFSEFDDKTVPPELLGRVLSRIEAEKAKRARRKRFVFALGFLCLAVAFLVPASIQLKSHLVSSGFGQLFSLLFSDFSVVIAHYQDFLMSLIEAVPMFAVTLVFAGLFLMVEAFRILAKDDKVVHKFINSRV